jgi:hypothetical protein
MNVISAGIAYRVGIIQDAAISTCTLIVPSSTTNYIPTMAPKERGIYNDCITESMVSLVFSLGSFLGDIGVVDVPHWQYLPVYSLVRAYDSLISREARMRILFTLGTCLVGVAIGRIMEILSPSEIPPHIFTLILGITLVFVSEKRKKGE